MELDGRQVTDVINDDWIINDEGETTIVVNGITLHDGATGATGDVAANGAWNVMMREEGVIVVDRSDPANWEISNPATGVFADRDFSAVDFNEIPSSLNNSPVFTEVYAAARCSLRGASGLFASPERRWGAGQGAATVT